MRGFSLVAMIGALLYFYRLFTGETVLPESVQNGLINFFLLALLPFAAAELTSRRFTNTLKNGGGDHIAARVLEMQQGITTVEGGRREYDPAPIGSEASATPAPASTDPPSKPPVQPII